MRRSDDQRELHDDGDAGYRNRLQHRLRFERLIAELSSRLIDAPAERFDTLICEGLGTIGLHFGVDRAYLFRFGPDMAWMSNTHEWVAEGISREADKLQQVPVSVFPWLMGELAAGRSVHVPRVANLPPEACAERSEFEREGIRSLAIVPFGDKTCLRGFIGFDAVCREHHWSEEVMLGLELLAQTFDSAFRAQAMAAELHRLALHDDLTGLANRKLLHDRLAQGTARSRRHGQRSAVMLIDLDDFKLVNDSFGHAQGDALLRATAKRLQSMVRDTDTVARLGGDEFVVVTEFDSDAGLEAMMVRITEGLRQPVPLGDETVTPAASIGVALCPEDGADPDSLLSRADNAMYEAKAQGKNRLRFHAPERSRDSRDVLRLREQLRYALACGQIIPFYQPRVCLNSGRLLAFEALARWRHPELGWLPPRRFIPLAEQMGVDDQIDLRILDAALAQLAEWRRTQPLLGISVNVSARHLAEPQMHMRLSARLREAGDLASGIELEITEGALIRDLSSAELALAALHGTCPGLRISLDDFGSGYSSLNYLRRLPLATLKIDQSFVADLEGDRTASTRAIIQSILDLGRNLGLQVMAEGVETAAQQRELVALGCCEGQGFYFSAPVPAAEATAMVRRGHIDGGAPPRA